MKTLRVLILLGAWVAFAAFSHPQELLTVDDLLCLLEHRTEEREILRLVKKAESIRLADADFAKLKAKGASEALLGAIRETVDRDIVGRVLALAAEGKTEADLLEWILTSGQRRGLTAEERLRLARGKIPASVIRAIEGRHIFPGFKSYRDPLGMLSMQHPEGWNTYHWYTSQGVKILLSPEAGVKGPNQFTTGVQVQIRFLEKGLFGHGESGDLLNWHRRSLQGFLRLNKAYDMKPIGDPRWTPLAGLQAVEQEFHLSMEKTPCRETLVRFNYEDLHYFVEGVAPKEKYPDLQKTFARMFRTLIPYPDRALASRRRERLEPNEALDLYRESVVMVRSVTTETRGGSTWTLTGFGSGFIARPDGYVLTNHHVICHQDSHEACDDPARWKVAGDFELVWDAAVPSGEPGKMRRTLKAVLVDSVYSDSPKIDMALLKVKSPPPGSSFSSIPLVPIESGLLREGDPVVALGFPRGDILGEGNLTLTSGAISRFNYLDHPLRRGRGRRDLDSLYTDAEIHQGNSGGPCVDLATGTVAGFNTFGLMDPTKEKGPELVFAGVVAIDHALFHFPQLRWFPMGVEPSANQRMELGAMLLARGATRAAGIQLEAALREAATLNAEQRGRLHYHLSLHRTRTGQDGEGHLDLSLKEDPRNTLTLLTRAYRLAYDRQGKAALDLADRALQVSPEDWSVHFHRAAILRILGKAADAEAAVAGALQMAGQSEPSLLRLRGRLLYEQKKPADGLAAFRQAAALDPSDVDSRLGVIEGLELQNDAASALKAVELLAREIPDDSRVQEKLARLLIGDTRRKDESIAAMALALDLWIDRKEPPRPELFQFICSSTLELEDRRSLYFLAALQLHDSWPKEAHDRLAKSWSRLGMTNLAALHQHLAQPGGPKMQALMNLNDTVKPFSILDAHEVVSKGYPAALLDELLEVTSLGFEPTPEVVGALKIGDLGQFRALTRAHRRDQLQASKTLRSFLEFRIEGGVELTPARARVRLTLRNHAPFPLTSLSVENRYVDGQGGFKPLPAISLDLVGGVLMPDEERTIDYDFHTWAELERNGIKRAAIKTLEVLPRAARNASFHRFVSIEGQLTTGVGYVFTIKNASAFAVTEFTLRCVFKNKSGEPLTRPDGSVVSATHTFKATLDSGGVSNSVTIADWGDEAVQAKLGVPPGTTPLGYEVTVTDVKIKK